MCACVRVKLTYVSTPYIDQRGTKGGWVQLAPGGDTSDLAPSPDFAMCYPLIIALNVAGTFKKT